MRGQHDSDQRVGPRSTRSRRSERNGALVRVVGAQFLGGTVEWAGTIALLVFAFERGGARATGLASLASFTAPLVTAPAIAVGCAAFPLARVRQAGLAVHALASVLAGVAMFADLPIPFVVVAAMLALGGLTVLAATGSSMIPAIVHTPRELVTANLWMGHAAAICVLTGPLFAAALMTVGSPALVMVGCAGLSSVALGLSVVDAGPPALRSAVHPVRETLESARTLARRPGAAGAVAVSFARHVLVGALDVLIVVIAFDAVDIGGAGAGLLSSAFGAGALLSLFVAGRVLRGERLAAPVVVALTASAGLCVVLAGALEVVPAFVILTVLGLSAAVVNTVSRMLVQRSADPRSLGQIFGLMALTDGVALLAGSLLAQVTLAVVDLRGALVAVGAVIGAIAAASVRSVRRTDDAAVVPVVQMSLLRHTPVFAPLPALELEPVARSATYHDVEAGEVVIRQGDHGDRFYVVVAGEFDVVMSGRHIRRAERTHTFGEVALLADVPRTATVTAATPGVLLAIDRVSFLTAVTGSDTSAQAAWGAVRAMDLDTSLAGGGPAPEG